MDPSLKIRDLVEVPPVQTVVRLEEGRNRPEAVTGSFVLTSDVAAHLSVLSEALQKDTGQGYFLVGDFGSGKSHFLAVLAAWLGDAPGAARITEAHRGLRRLRDRDRRLLPVDISLINYRSTTPLEQLVVRGIERALAAAGVRVALSPLVAFLHHLHDLCRDPSLAAAFAESCDVPAGEVDRWIDGHPREAYTAGVRFIRELGLPTPQSLGEDRHETFARALDAVKRAGFAGVTLLLDELSEFLRSKPDTRQLNEDARTLQFLGELAATQPLWIVGAVQESIERTGDIAQVTFRKIKDRFPIRLTLSTVHIRDLVAQRLVVHKPGADQQLTGVHSFLREHFPTFSCSYEPFRLIYPVHPATLSLLEGLGDLFSEHRGIVDFVHARLAGDASRHIEGILDRPAAELLAPDSIFDHFSERLAQFSDFNVYPRHVVPHLDSVAESVLEDPADRDLARRLVRMLVLYRIHPTAAPPTVRQLTEMLACVPAPGRPDLNVQFVAEALLDPLVDASRFLTRKPGESGDPLDAVYAVVTEADPGKTLQARIAQVAEEFPPEDTRAFVSALSALPESGAWPGEAVLRGCVQRPVAWRGSRRKLLLAFCFRGQESERIPELVHAITAGEADLAVVCTLWDCDWEDESGAIAVWRIPVPKDPEGALATCFAARTVATGLDPANAADAALLDPARDAVERAAPAAQQAAVDAFYAGGFVQPRIRVEPAICQLRRFDRLLETAASTLLDTRFPRFAEIAPRGAQPSARLYQHLIDELVVPGSISLQDARRRGLTGIIEGLGTPLGLVDVRSGAYLFSPDPASHPLLSYVVGLLRPSAPTPTAEVLHALQTGPFGVPQDTAQFLLTALACAGLVTLVSKGRPLPLEFLRLTAVETAEAVAPGELINHADSETLLGECSFLAPAHGWESFGLKQQREAWQAAVKFKDTAGKLLSDMSGKLDELSSYSAFGAFDLGAVREKLHALDALTGHIRVSHSAREGLERFTNAWRATELTDGDIRSLQCLHRFCARHTDALVFANHYLRHPVVERACTEDQALADSQAAAVALLADPERLIADGGVAVFDQAFEEFRERYAELYARRHAELVRLVGRPSLDKHARRAVAVLKRLSAIDVLDRPEGLDVLLADVDAPQPKPCARNVAESLVRSPVCDCGYALNEPRVQPEPGAAVPRIDACLRAYLGILAHPGVLEASKARAFALRDANPVAAQRLTRLTEAMLDPDASSPAALLDLIDDATTEELAQALAGSVDIQRRDLAELTGKLSGRRLTPRQVEGVVKQWIGEASDSAVLAVEGGASGTDGVVATAEGWWPLLRQDVCPSPSLEEKQAVARALEPALQQRFPAAELTPSMSRLPYARLHAFVLGEPFHTAAVREGWSLLAERALAERGEAQPDTAPSAHVDPVVAAAVSERLACLDRLCTDLAAEVPVRLRARLGAAAVCLDAWSTQKLKDACHAAIRRLERLGDEWVATLAPVRPVALATCPIIVVLDAVPADVWLTVADQLGGDLVRGASQEWFRLDGTTDTPSGMAAMLGTHHDPVDELAARGVPYVQVSGHEPHALADALPASAAATGAVVRVNAFDRGSHEGALSLPGMPAAVAALCTRHLVPLAEACRQRGQRLVLTTDHGLSFTEGRAGHGRGRAFERTVFRLTWDFDA